jgi:hypothetical protein
MYQIIYNTELERVKVYKDGILLGECESYELDAIFSWLEVQYVEVDGDEW